MVRRLQESGGTGRWMKFVSWESGRERERGKERMDLLLNSVGLLQKVRDGVIKHLNHVLVVESCLTLVAHVSKEIDPVQL